MQGTQLLRPALRNAAKVPEIISLSISLELKTRSFLQHSLGFSKVHVITKQRVILNMCAVQLGQESRFWASRAVPCYWCVDAESFLSTFTLIIISKWLSSHWSFCLGPFSPPLRRTLPSASRMRACAISRCITLGMVSYPCKTPMSSPMSLPLQNFLFLQRTSRL